MRKYLTAKNLPTILILVVMLVSLPIVIYQVQQKQELRKRAAFPEAATLTLQTTTTSYQVGEVIKVNINLDTGNRAIPTTGADVLLEYAPEVIVQTTPPSEIGVIEPLKITPGNIYDTYPIQEIDTQNKIIKISGSASDIGSYFSGSGTFALIEFRAVESGRVTLNFIFKGTDATDDTNVVGLIEGQPQERLAIAPSSLALDITELGPSPSPPLPSPTPTSFITPTLSPSPFPTPSPPTPTSPIGWVKGYVFEDSNFNHQEDPGEPRVGGMTVTLYQYYGEYDSMKVFDEAITDDKGIYHFSNLPPGKYSLSILNTPGYNYYTVVGGQQNFKITGGEAIAGAIFGLLPQYKAAINFNLILEERGPCGFATDVAIYGSISATGIQAFGLLGKTQTDITGSGSVTLGQDHLGKTYSLFARTPSHLRKIATSSATIREGYNYVDFGKLIPGDLFIAPGATEQDNVINAFDLAELFQNWGPTGASTPPAPADFNCDGSVNSWDVKTIFENFGKTGDGPTTLTPTPTPLPTGSSVILKADVDRGSQLSPGQTIQFQGAFVTPESGQPGCLANNTTQVEVIFRGEIYNLVSYSNSGWTWWPTGEPKVLLAYLPCGSENNLNFTLQVQTPPPEPPSPNVTGVITISASQDILIKDIYPFSL